MCYVDEGGDVATRRAELMDYGFECACERCVREAAGLGQARHGGGDALPLRDGARAAARRAAA